MFCPSSSAVFIAWLSVVLSWRLLGAWGSFNTVCRYSTAYSILVNLRSRRRNFDYAKRSHPDKLWPPMLLSHQGLCSRCFHRLSIEVQVLLDVHPLWSIAYSSIVVTIVMVLRRFNLLSASCPIVDDHCISSAHRASWDVGAAASVGNAVQYLKGLGPRGWRDRTKLSCSKLVEQCSQVSLAYANGCA